MRIRTLAAVALTALLALTGCTGKAIGGDDDAAAGGDVTLDWWIVTQTSDTGTATLKSIIADFQRANPTIKINVQFRGVDAHKDALRTTAGSSSGPDIYYNWAGPGLGGEMVDAGVSLDLTKYYEQYKWTERFNESTLKAYKQYGGYHGVPWTQRTEVVYYHKDQFAKAGVTAPPTTYGEWTAAAQKLKSAGLTPIAMGGKDNWHVMRLLDTFIETNCGAEKGDQLNTRKASWAGEPCVDESFAQLKTWSDNYFNKGFAGLAQTQAAALFTSGKAAMALEGDWFTPQAIEAGADPENIGVFPLPTGTGRLYGFSEGQYLAKAGQHPDQAAKFLDYLSSAEVESKNLGVFAAIPVNKDTKPATAQQPLNIQIAELTKSAKGFFLNNDQNFPTDVTTEYWRIQNAVTAGSIKPDDAGEQLQKFIDSHR
ncbi:ABC transporter substrate-binding protein [Micromonospora sp. BQ11]|uniref:ABC transporter substrate-binding protein n=1 Tax=Micromonospora sp. BQ11 TaxID=3452212 RepID=UPI003F8C4974